MLLFLIDAALPHCLQISTCNLGRSDKSRAREMQLNFTYYNYIHTHYFSFFRSGLVRNEGLSLPRSVLVNFNYELLAEYLFSEQVIQQQL
jgi:hypothetical protein